MKTNLEIIEELTKNTIFKENECWIYNGYSRGGYGQINIDGIQYDVHRLSCSIFHNLDLNDSKQLACHKSNCNSKRCWNPDHLYNGSHATNAKDALDSGKRPNKYKDATHCVHGHEFTPENTRIYRRKRFCKICNRTRPGRISKLY